MLVGHDEAQMTLLQQHTIP